MQLLGALLVCQLVIAQRPPERPDVTALVTRARAARGNGRWTAYLHLDAR